MGHKKRKEDIFGSLLEELSEDPIIQHFVKYEVDSIFRSVDLKVLVERLANRHQIPRDLVLRAVVLALVEILSET
jgi:hypothetical protein